MSYNPTPYRISTITATGSVNTELDLDLLFNHFKVFIVDNGVGKTPEHKYGVVYAEFSKKKSDTYFTDFSKKFLSQKKKENKSKRFDNQLTVIYKYNDESLMNIKMFKNGNIQITGVKSIQDGSNMIDILISIIKNICVDERETVKDIAKMANNNYKVALINSDFKIGFEIKRDKLYTILINSYHNKCSFEPCIYPGVKIQYFWNSHNHKKNGVCCCRTQCSVGKNDGHGENRCKKITIAVFQSGCIIITGAQTTEQIDEVYQFICNVLNTHIEYLKKVNLNTILPEKSKVEKVKIMLKKSTIIYPQPITK
jgi:TATA-box binding protein (TBP) (component of TFIID and TFIIIB)